MGEVANVVQRLSTALYMKLKIVGHDKDSIMSPNLWRGWEAPDASFGDTAHNSLRAVLEQSTGPYAHDSSLAKDSKAPPPALSQVMQIGNLLSRLLLGGAAASSSDAPPPAALDHHVEDPAVASSDTRPSTPVEGFYEQLKEMGSTDQWAAAAHNEKGAKVLAAAIELQTQKEMGDDRGATEGDAQHPADGYDDQNSPEATNQSSQVSR